MITPDTHTKFIDDEDKIIHVVFSKQSGLPVVFCEHNDTEHLDGLLSKASDLYELREISYREAINIQQDLIQKD